MTMEQGTQTRDAQRGAEDLSPLQDADAPFYTIGQVSAILGIPQAALRRLDDQDIVSPERSEGGQRRYSRQEVERLREVLTLTDEGVTLPGVRKVLALRRQVESLEEELADLRGRGADDRAGSD
ncbi:MerR family transcriptional regulator [Microbacterium album]|uniref:HTH merR-type domain-containing protein n=1 Tax=Microbacterium album TaxID=2053191 RepID=A0A917IFR1_9MICO|nr:MerR family transcriptional regulator [Microbacterium album]GGH48733.1 hypothetical protein GCM10010921_26430 [Microbacterium album]